MRQPTLDEAAKIIDAGDAMAKMLGEMSARGAPPWWNGQWLHDLVNAWWKATEQVAP